MPTTYTATGREGRILCKPEVAGDDIEITIDPDLIKFRKSVLPVIKKGWTYKVTILPASGTINGESSLVMYGDQEAVNISEAEGNLHWS